MKMVRLEKFKEVGLNPKDKKFFTIKKSQRCQTKAGKSLDFLQPRVVEIVDGKPVDITFKKLVGNGSKVSLMMRYVDQEEYGISSYPSVLKVTELVTYELDGDGNGGGSIIGEDEEDFLGGELELDQKPVNAQEELDEYDQAGGSDTPQFDEDDGDEEYE